MNNTTQSFNLTDFIIDWVNAWTSNGRTNPEDLLLSYYTEDCFYADPGLRTGIKGKDKLRYYLKKLLFYNPAWKWEVIEIIPTAKGCVVKWKVDMPVENEHLFETGLDIIEIKDGLISRNEAFFDRHAWLTKLLSYK